MKYLQTKTIKKKGLDVDIVQYPAHLSWVVLSLLHMYCLKLPSDRQDMVSKNCSVLYSISLQVKLTFELCSGWAREMKAEAKSKQPSWLPSLLLVSHSPKFTECLLHARCTLAMTTAEISAPHFFVPGSQAVYLN